MEPTNFANRHDTLGVGRDLGPTTAQVQNDPARFAPVRDTLAPAPAATGAGDSSLTLPVRHHQRRKQQEGEREKDDDDDDDDDEATRTRAAVAAQTEIGDPRGRIPTGRDARRQLAAIRDSELPVGASRTAEVGGAYAYGYDHEDDDYGGGGGGAPFLSHEQLVSPEEEEHRRQAAAVDYNNTRVVPPELPPRTHGHDYAYAHVPTTTATSNITSTAPVGAGRSSAGRSSPGASLGSKVKGALAQVHGASEIVRGNIRAAIDSAVGDEARQAEDEDILRQGQREYTTRKLDKGGRSDSFPG